MPDVPPPEELPSEAELKERLHRPRAASRAALLGARAADRAAPGRSPPLSLAARSAPPCSTSGYARPARFRDDPAIHHCVLAYASDMTLLDTALFAHGRIVFDRDLQVASLDHALWFHRPFRADEWLLYAEDSPSAPAAAASPAAACSPATGVLVASVGAGRPDSGAPAAT